MAEFFESPILPGQTIPKHEHRRLLGFLVVFIIIAIIVGLSLFWGYNKKEIQISPNPVVKSELELIADKLSNSVVEISQEEKAKIAKDLAKSVVPITEKQKTDIANSLSKSAK